MKKIVVLVFSLSLVLIITSCSNNNDHSDSVIQPDLLMFISDKYEPLISFDLDETVLSFYLKQDCIIKQSYQRFIIESTFWGKEIPISLIGCCCETDVSDLFVYDSYRISYNNHQVIINNTDTFPEQYLSPKIDSIFNKKRMNTTDFLFTLEVEDSLEMKNAERIIKEIYLGYMTYIWNTYVINKKFYYMSKEDKKVLARSNRLRLRVIPISKLSYPYCSNCACE